MPTKFPAFHAYFFFLTLASACAGSQADPGGTGQGGDGAGGGPGEAGGYAASGTGGGSEQGGGSGGMGTIGGNGSGGSPATGGNRTGGNGNTATGGMGGLATGGMGGLATGGMGGQSSLPIPVRIQALGDSITQGKMRPEEATYRRPLWKKLQAAGYKVDFVGSTNQQLDGPHYFKDYDPDHEGHYGWRITDVLPKLDGWLQSYTPDVSLIHLGTNDSGASNGQTMIASITQVIDKLRAKNPRVIIIVAKLILPGPNAVQFGNMLPALATAKGTEASPIIVVDQTTGFTSADTIDGIHPNPMGQEKMATVWFNALAKILPKP